MLTAVPVYGSGSIIGVCIVLHVVRATVACIQYMLAHGDHVALDKWMAVLHCFGEKTSIDNPSCVTHLFVGPTVVHR